jgi:hypothetical protein
MSVVFSFNTLIKMLVAQPLWDRLSEASRWIVLTLMRMEREEKEGKSGPIKNLLSNIQERARHSGSAHCSFRQSWDIGLVLMLHSPLIPLPSTSAICQNPHLSI